MPLQQIWRLSQLWYDDRLDEDFQGRSIPDAEAIFRQAGLQGSFWEWSDRR